MKKARQRDKEWGNERPRVKGVLCGRHTCTAQMENRTEILEAKDLGRKNSGRLYRETKYDKERERE